MTKTKETRPAQRICIDLDEKIYIEFKKKSVEELKSMAVIIRNLIIAYIKK
ncbi:MAG: hypothetical protein IKP00_10140 [Victivallales bacterium]|nr:hypothetical protein [Victivallales bacterium]